MKGEIVSLKTARKPSGLILSQTNLDDYIEENADFYHEQVKKISQEYGGRMITDKRLHMRLYLTHADARVHDDKVLEIIRYPDYPAEEFYCIQLGFEIPALKSIMPNDRMFVAWKWFFFRRPRGFRGVTIG